MVEELIGGFTSLSTNTVAFDKENGVSFFGKSLKLNDANDAKVVVDAIKSSKNMEFLNLEGNTLGVEAAKVIGNAIGSHPELKRALWKDIFTGRMKDEIPEALRFLGSGLDLAKARLVVLDLSDNAFGPIGMEGLASLLRSSACQSLQELLLNNNGLGITGAKLLSKALMDCYESSKSVGKPLPLRVFVAGRNRLENVGITYLSKVFEVLGTLEEIRIPQNGIYHAGIKELCEALKKNPRLKVLNLNDNTVGPKGCQALAEALPSLQELQTLDLGDCLIRNRGSLTLAAALQPGHSKLETLILDHASMKIDGGLAVVTALENKPHLKHLMLDGNQFGDKGIEEIKREYKKIKAEDTLGSFSEDEGEDDEDEDDSEDEDNVTIDDDESSRDESEDDLEAHNVSAEKHDDSKSKRQQSFNKERTSPVREEIMTILSKITAADFLKFPTPERFLALGSKESEQILHEIKNDDDADYLESLLTVVMKVSSLTTEKSVGAAALACSGSLYQHLFTWVEPRNNLSLLNNSLLVHLGLIKSEDKKWKPQYNQVGCIMALNNAMSQNYFPQASKDTIKHFLSRVQNSVETITIS